jgi:DNA invertase Pin-like site-specific DNA recombinase
MAEKQLIAYYRVSTQKQGASGLGLDAQKQTVTGYVKNAPGALLSEFCEVETGKGSNALEKRPELRKALDECRKRGAVLIIAKLDRLARNVHFISGLMESRVQFVACDLPEANQLTLHIMAAFAEHEARRISERTRDALAAAKARGVTLGRKGYANLAPLLAERQAAAQRFAEEHRGLFEGMQLRGLSQRAMASELNRLGMRGPRNGKWSLCQVHRTLHRLQSGHNVATAGSGLPPE